MVDHFNEQNRRDIGIVWFIIGCVFLFVGYSGGIVFFLLGGAWLASALGQGLELFRLKPDFMRALLKTATVGLLGIAGFALLLNAIH
jgi:Na+/proline symporter